MMQVTRVTFREIRSHCSRRSFLFAVIGLPLYFAMIYSLFGFASWVKARSPVTVGYVLEDSTSTELKVPAKSVSGRATSPIVLVRFDNDEAAKQALLTNSVASYFVIPSGFPDTETVKVFSRGSSELNSPRIQEILLPSYIPDIDLGRLSRALYPFVTIDINPAAENKQSEGEQTSYNKEALGLVLLLLFPLFWSGGTRIVHAFAEERENHNLDLLLSSLSPTKLFLGKTLGQATLLIFHLVSVSIMIQTITLFKPTQADAVAISHESPSFSLFMLFLKGLLVFLAYIQISAVFMAFTCLLKDRQSSSAFGGVISILLLLSFIFFEKLKLWLELHPLALLLFPLTSAPTSIYFWMEFGIMSVQTMSSCLILGSYVIASVYFGGQILTDRFSVPSLADLWLSTREFLAQWLPKFKNPVGEER